MWRDNLEEVQNKELEIDRNRQAENENVENMLIRSISPLFYFSYYPCEYSSCADNFDSV